MLRVFTSVPFLALTLLSGCLSLGNIGCADAITSQATRGTSAVMIAAIEKARFTNMDFEGQASVHNPKYIVKGVAGTGVYFEAEVQIVGVDCESEVTADGYGSDAPLSPEANAAVRDLLKDQPDLLERLLKVTSPEAAPAVEPKPPTQ